MKISDIVQWTLDVSIIILYNIENGIFIYIYIYILHFSIQLYNEIMQNLIFNLAFLMVNYENTTSIVLHYFQVENTSLILK